MRDIKAKELLLKFKTGNCTEEELAVLESWYLEDKDMTPADLNSEVLAEVKARVWKTLPVHELPMGTVKLWRKIAAVAAVFICTLTALFFYQKKYTQPVNSDRAANIVPGGNKAILTLADGSTIALDDAVNGTLASQPGILITKNKDGQIIYSVSKENETGNAPVYNTVETPRGGQYQINLPDGTKVWLNAASSIKFPTSFEGDERKVELNGEGYFEVAKNKYKPFRVVSGRQVVEVLGTHFNINSYNDEEQIKTTLVEGRVSVAIGTETVILKPGQQAVANQKSIHVEAVNTDDVIAWKENSFVFNNEDLGSIMRKISRWYDVDVICPPELGKMTFGITVSRNKSIKQVLYNIEETGTVHFKIEGRRITVMP
ncbi:MAG: DUF4974 domain-containing protein [Candidatus Pedobacter colombiensis]|uniref:DUF4974 domain-containing protein n=1 Tax=Candidatus Pedobacter colombiensis TaxID=3121371 RepID=A0AAJ6B8C4_9SPHI|nr:FecR family protein [Pedobacter sp.]WEK18993.1 MAG: DUF4974 domain-containing protein [Pedobacter sp.]